MMLLSSGVIAVLVLGLAVIAVGGWVEMARRAGHLNNGG